MLNIKWWAFSLLIIGHTFGYITRIAVRLPLEGSLAAPGAPWPKPYTWSNSTKVRTLNPSTFTMEADVTGCDVIDSAMQRYASLFDLDPLGVPDPSLTQISRLVIDVANKTCDPAYYPHQDMDESYSLVIDGSTDARLSSKTIWGTLRGLETLSQLIYLTNDKKYQLNETSIDDAPRFSYRGLMLDTARHFMHMDIIINVLDAMSWDKFNVLHWHVVDDQSFPYPSRTYPELMEKGAYSAYHRYTRDDVTTILHEARLRGIRVIPEFDTPGHTWSWGVAYPELITPCWGEGLSGGPYKPNYPIHGDREVMYPISEFTYEFLNNFYQEIVEDFPDKFVHLGLDEAYYSCWESNPNITEWMQEMNYTEYYQVEEYYTNRLIDIVESKATDYVIWQDPIDHGVTVSPRTIVQVWKSFSDSGITWQEHMVNVTSSGYNTILSSPWYLNYIEYGQEWKDLYMIEPHNFTDDATKWDYVKGGAACIWAEYVDGTNILSRLWPRASAVAERLWSRKEETDVESAKYRLDQHRCRYVRRGIPAQPILNGYCGDYEWTNDKNDETKPIDDISGQSPIKTTVWLLMLAYIIARVY